MGRLACIAVLLAPTLSFAQGATPPQGEIEMEGDPAPEPAPDAQAAPVVKDAKVAKTWQQAGETLIKKGDQLTKQNLLDDAKVQFTNAVVAFQKAIEAGDDPALLIALAVAEDKVGSTPDALAHLKQLLATAGVRPDVMKKAQAKLDELGLKVGLVKLVVSPAGTTVTLGDKPLGAAPLAEPLVLMPGEYTVWFAAPGYQQKSLELTIDAGSESERTVDLDVTPPVIKTQEDDVEVATTPIAVRGPSKLPLYVGASATVGLVVVATVTGLVAVSKHNTYVDPGTPSAERKDLQSSGKSFALVTDLAMIGAIGAGAFTAYWYLMKWSPAKQAYDEKQPVAARRPKVELAPWVQAQSGGLVVGGSF